MHFPSGTSLSSKSCFTLSLPALITTFIIFSAIVAPVQSSSTNVTSTEELERQAVENALQLVQQYKESVRERLWAVANRTEVLTSSSKTAAKNGDGPGCLQQLRSALSGPLDRPPFEWLLQMYDSSGSLPSGILSGTTTSLGDFEQCLHGVPRDFASLPSSNSGGGDQQKATSSSYETQYCLLTLRARRSEQHRFTPLNFGNSSTSSSSAWERDHLQRWLVTDNKVPIVVGLCLPASCNGEERLALGRAASTLVARFDSKVEFCQASSAQLQKDNLTDFVLEKLWQLWPMLLVLSALSFTVGLGTFLDYLTETQLGRNWAAQLELLPVRLVRCFSLITNTRMLYDVSKRRGNGGGETGAVSKSKSKSKQSDSNNNNNNSSSGGGVTNVMTAAERRRRAVSLDLLDGLRVLTILWIIVAHCVSMTQVPFLMKVSPVAHFPWTFFENRDANWLVSSYLLSTYYPVSIFFMVSGILVIYGRPKSSSSTSGGSGKKPRCDTTAHFVRHLLTRLFRLLPTLLATMALTYSLRYLGSGPLFHQQLVAPYVEPCRTHFWYHLLLVHNFLPIDQRCGSHTWYVGADFQLNLVAFLVVHLIRCRNRWFVGLLAAVALNATSGLIPLALAACGLGPIPNFNVYVDPRINFPTRDLILFYYASYVHASSFFMGVVLGYLLSSGWDFNFLIKNKLTRFVWLNAASATVSAVPLAMRYFVYPDDSTTSTTSATMTNGTLLSGSEEAAAAAVEAQSPLFTAFLFQFFAYTFNLAMGTVIFICAINPSLYVSQFLSGRVFRPLSRLVFSAYLSHQAFIWFSVQQARAPIVVNVYSLVCFIAMIVSMTILASIGLYLTVELPFMRVAKLLFAAPTNGSSSSAKSRHQHPLKLMHSISTVEAATSAASSPSSSSPYSHSTPLPSSSTPAGRGGGDPLELQSIIVRQHHHQPPRASDQSETVTDVGDSDATGGGGGGCLADQNNNSQTTTTTANRSFGY